MLLSLSLVFSFQSLFGHLYSWIGILTAIFMAGSAVGALLMTRMLPRMQSPCRTMLVSEMSVLVAAALLPVLIPPLGPLLEHTAAFTLLRILYLVLPFVCGVLTGAPFPLASLLRERRTRSPGSTAGALYAADLLGGWLGGWREQGSPS